MLTPNWEQIRSKLPTWDELRPIGRSPIVQASVLFPPIGYLLLLNSHLLELGDIDARFRLVALGTPWRLVLTYYGLAFLAVGTVIFAWRCPKQVKQYPTATEFTSEALSFLVAAPHRKAAAIETLREGSDWDHDNGKIAGLDREHLRKLLTSDRGLTSADADTALVVGLNIEWTDANASRSFSRTISLASFVVGFAVLAIPTVLTFAEVTVWIWRTLTSVGLG